MESTGSLEVKREKDWTRGSVTRNLLSLSWPMIVTEGLYMIGISIDMVWVGKLGAAAVAGIGIAGIYAGFQMMLMNGLGIGIRALVARFVGSGDIEQANHTGQQTFIIGVLYTLVMVILGLTLSEIVLTLMGLEPDVIAVGTDYMRIMFGFGSVTVAFWLIGYSIMQASGDAVTPLAIVIFYRLVHIPLSYALVFGWGLFPDMGASGAAMANVISRGIGMVLVLWALFTGRAVRFDWDRWLKGWADSQSSGNLLLRACAFMAVWRIPTLEKGRLRLTMRHFRIDLSMVWRMVKIGIPASVMGVQRSLSLVVVAWLTAPFGTLAVAAHSLMQRVEMLLIPINIGLGTASGVLAGQNMGAGHPGRAERGSWQAVGLSTAFMVICSVVVLVWAENIVSIFSTEPDIVEMTSTFMRIAAAGYVVLGLGVVLGQSLSGTGDTVPPMVIGMVASWLVILPLAYLLPEFTEMGVLGIRWALVAGLLVTAIATVFYFRLGRWKRKRV